jgi:MFS family permease
MCLVFFIQYLDKQSLAYTSVYGLLEDLSLSPTQYSWLTSGFYLTQLVAEVPFIYIMSRLPLAATIGVTILAWGIACMALAAPQEFAGFLAVRCLLGLAETIVAPAFITLVSTWYTKEEHPLRVAAYVSCNGVAQVVGSFMMYGIGEHASSFGGLAPWRVMFLICGGITIAVGVLFLCIIPAGPDTAWFLTPHERIVAARRMASYQDAGDKSHFSWPQFREAAADVQTLHGFLFGVLVTLSAPVLTFATLVIKNLGYTPAQTLLYGSPSGAVQIVFIWAGVGLCTTLKRRALSIMLIGLIPLIGSILLFVLPTDDSWGIIVASWLASINNATSVVFMSMLASNVRGNTKKSTINALFNIGYCVGFIVGPQLWYVEVLPFSTSCLTKSLTFCSCFRTAPPRYRGGVIATIICWLLIITVLVPWYWWVLDRRNRIRDHRRGQHHGNVDDHSSYSSDEAVTTSRVQQIAMEDLTDRQNKAFRYTT